VGRAGEQEAAGERLPRRRRAVAHLCPRLPGSARRQRLSEQGAERLRATRVAVAGLFVAAGAARAPEAPGMAGSRSGVVAGPLFSDRRRAETPGPRA
jgi:hypothetical protein